MLEQRNHEHRAQAAAFNKTLDGQLAAHAAEFQRTGKLRVAYDLRHLPPQSVGTRTYAVNLARALAGLPQIELTLLVASPIQADGLEGRVVTEEQWTDDVAVIHKPAQVFDRRALAILFGSSAHVVITYQDLISYRIPIVFPSDREFEAYRTTSSLSLQAAQAIVVYSESTAREIASEFGIPRQEIVVTPLGVEAEWFAHREPGDALIARKLDLPPRYFFSLATDLPHKNIACLLDAYALMRSRWSGGELPELVLAGYSMGARAGLYDAIDSETRNSGVRFIGPVSALELRVLYQRALAVAYPSLYEGFGLPPLEAMAAGTPVVAMAFSSLPEVGGDAVLVCRQTVGCRTGQRPGASGHGRTAPERLARARLAAGRRVPLGENSTSHVRGLSIGRARARRTLAPCSPDVARGNPALVPALIIRTVGRSRSAGRCSDDVSIAGCAQRLARVECRSEREDAPRAETLQARQGSRDVLTSRDRRPPSARGKHRTPTGAPSLRRARITSHLPTSRRSRSRHHRRDMDARTNPSRLWPNRPGPGCESASREKIKNT